MTAADPIRETVTVRTDPDRAFELFTVGMGDWWPVDDYSRAVSELADDHVHVARLEFQPRLGGAILEHVSDGRTLPWGEVVDWNPPRRVVMAWRPHALPEPPTVLEATFTAVADGTVVEVEHRGWKRVSDGFRAQMYEIYVRGWASTIQRYAEVANRAAR